MNIWKSNGLWKKKRKQRNGKNMEQQHQHIKGIYYHPDTRTTHQTSGAVVAPTPPTTPAAPPLELKIVEHNVQSKPLTPPSVKQDFSIMGLGVLTTEYKWKLDSESLTIDWTAPKIELSEWHRAVSFLIWANKTHKCEAQLRLYINVNTGQAVFWAYPQSIRGGLSTQEYADAAHPEYEEFKNQRAQFPEDQGWKYAGTLHSHCDASAFQSGTDHANEIHIDGWHITVGKLDKKVIDLHCRLRANNIFIEVRSWKDMIFKLPNEVETVISGMPEIREKLLSSLIEAAPADGLQFPEVWKTNMKERPQVNVVSSTTTTSTTYYGGHHQHGSFQQSRVRANTIPYTLATGEFMGLFGDSAPVAFAVRDLRIDCEAVNDAWCKTKLSEQQLDAVIGLCQTMKQKFMIVAGALDRYRDGLKNGAKNPVIEEYLTRNNLRLEYLITQFEEIRKDWDLVDLVNCCEATGMTLRPVLTDINYINDVMVEIERAVEAEVETKKNETTHPKDWPDGYYGD